MLGEKHERDRYADLEDLVSVAESKDEPTISHEQVVEELKKNGFL